MTEIKATQWVNGKLGDYLSVLTDYHANGSYKVLKSNVELLDHEGYAVMIRTTNFERYDFYDELKYIDEHAYRFLKKSRVQPGDILMNKIANAGSVYLMPDLHRPVSLAMNLFLLRTQPEKVDQRYVYYYLKAHESYIKNMTVGTAAATITKDAVRNVDILLPPLDDQRKIGAMLFKYDRLIFNCARRIRLLDKTIMHIFEHWFVRFHVSKKDRPALKDSELGPVPADWEIASLGDMVDFVRGVEPGSKNYFKQPAPDRVPFLRVGDLGDRTYNVFVSAKIAGDRILDRADIALTLDGTVGIVKIGLRGCYSTGIRKAHIKVVERLGWAYLYCLLRSEQIQSIIRAHARGTTILHAGSATEHMRFALPPMRLIEQFEKCCAPILKSILNLEQKIANLRRTRDVLLPNLTSGEIDVENLDIKVPAENGAAAATTT
jgi:type I restriction enzyme S subunit